MTGNAVPVLVGAAVCVATAECADMMQDLKTGYLVGLSMYLPLAYILPYGIGCLANMTTTRLYNARWVEDKGVPFAAGLLVGEPLIVLLQSILIILGVIQPPA